MSAAKFAVPIACLLGGALCGYALNAGGPSQSEIDDLQAQLTTLQDEIASLTTARETAQKEARSSDRELKAARRDLKTAQTQAEELAAAAAVAPEPVAADPVAVVAGATWEERVGKYPAYAFADSDEAISDAMESTDWVVIAENMSAMVPIANNIAKAILAGTPPSPEDIGNAQRHNGPLVVAALTLNQAGVPGTGPNGSFSHPSFMTNSIAASLDALGHTLSADQQAKLGKLGADYSRRDQERTGAYGDDVPKLRQILEEAELKQAYFKDVFAMLDAAQRDALSPPESRDRMQLDVFSAALVWAGRIRPMGFRDRAHLVSSIEGAISGEVDFNPEGRAHQIIVEWADRLPDEILTLERDALEQSNLYRLDYVNLCAKQFVELIETLRRDGELPQKAHDALRDSQGTIIPFPMGE